MMYDLLNLSDNMSCENYISSKKYNVKFRIRGRLIEFLVGCKDLFKIIKKKKL